MPRAFVAAALFITVSNLAAQESTPTPKSAPEAVDRGIAILLSMPEGEGENQWPYEGVYRVDGEIPIGYRCGGTAICADALLQLPDYAGDDKRKTAVAAGLEFVLSSLEDPRMSADFIGRYDVRGWGHAYALQFLLDLESVNAVPKGREKAVGKAVKWLIKTLEASAIPKRGGWNYSLPGGFGNARNAASPFMTGPTLQALFLARSRGHEVSKKIVEEAMSALERGRSASGGYAYSAPAESIEDLGEDQLRFMDLKPGSSGRMCVVEATLELAGRGDQQRLVDAVATFFRHHDALKVRKRKNGTHIEPYGVAPYYFMYAHYHAAQAISLITDAKERDAWRSKLETLLLDEQEAGGGWNDRVFPRSMNYGTAMAVQALTMSGLKPRARWTTQAAEAGN